MKGFATSSRLRKNGRRDLDFLRALRSCDSGESFGIIRWWPEDPYRAGKDGLSEAARDGGWLAECSEWLPWGSL
jgi:hypothetical protein